jgi:ABC-type transport system involved in cytochrome c biogenesis permease component
MKNWFLKYEQVILFFSLVIYMVTLTVVFDYELKTTNWAGIVWVIQFFGLSTLLALRGIKKGWSWPSRP